MKPLRLCATLVVMVLVVAGCAQRFLQVPIPYKTKADAGPETWSCVTMGLADLGFVFSEGLDPEDSLGRRVTARGSGRNHLEFVRLKLSEEDDGQVLEMSLGISTRRTALDPDSPLAIGSLGSPSRQSIGEVDALMARCQRSPIFGGMGS